MKSSLDNIPRGLAPAGYVPVRGVPVAIEEVVQFEQKFGGMLFDEVVFKDHGKRIACANIINALDRKLALMRALRGDLRWLPESIDINDPGWLYIPVGFHGLESVPSKDKPAGVVGWFRVKKYFKIK